MRTFDLAPLYRSAIGFDRLASLLEQRAESQPSYPPYNVELLAEDKYRIATSNSASSWRTT
jgi:molecular chaperone IbpA